MSPGPDLWPDPAQRLALIAATADVGEAVDAWRELVGRFDLAELWDPEVYRLLPLVWHRLGDDVGGAHVERLKGAYRKAWVTNQHLQRCAAEAVVGLEADGVESLVVSGLALGPLVYDDAATRPTHTADLLVRPGDAGRAWHRLEALGYRTRAVPTRTPRRWRADTDDAWFHRTGRPRSFTRGPLDAVEVHTSLVDPPSGRPGPPRPTDLHRGAWDDAVPIDLGGRTVRTLSPSHHLLRALAGGAGGDLRSTVDALTISRRPAGEVDWSAVVESGHRHHLGLRLADGLARLDHLGADLPHGLRSETLRPRPDRRERLAHRLAAGATTDAGGDRLVAARLVAATRGTGPLTTVARGPRLVADHWQVDHPRHLPLVVVWRLREAGREHRRR